ncbi:TPA: hypothetical protein ACXKAZ_000365 [Pseudomonas aeruginosa]|nr:hypothetical protein [Pseudomonas aeruginosa]HBO5585608.1 hypothetical protein [Pseudomonas aeruginosa]
MLWRSLAAAASVLLFTSQTFAGDDPLVADLKSQSVSGLKAMMQEVHGRCRGGSGDSPETWKYCDRQDVIYKEIVNRGWCWGPDDVVEAQKGWIECAGDKPPRFDVPAYCKSLSSLSGTPSEVLYGGCMSQEQSAYNGLKAGWKSIPDAIKKHCAGIAKLDGIGSYSLLSGCVEQELQAKKANAAKSFEY